MDTTSRRAVDVIAELFAGEGAADYRGEQVTQAAHWCRLSSTTHRCWPRWSGKPRSAPGGRVANDPVPRIGVVLIADTEAGRK